MKPNSLEQMYHQIVARRDAILQHYLANGTLKMSDPVSYHKYRKELRDINKRLRIIRQCIPANPVLLAEIADEDSRNDNHSLEQYGSY